ncbi:MAG: hypothetical protein V4534_07060 [Myxococcota bacterium]
MRTAKIFLSIYVAVFGLTSSAFVNFEHEMLSDFVKETKQIEVPGFPDAFNPSIVRWHGALLMSFRTGHYELASDCEEDSFLMSFRFRSGADLSTNNIGLVFLNPQFKPVGPVQVLNISYKDSSIEARQQDPRLISIDGKIYMAYSNIIAGKEQPEIRRMFVAELIHNGREFEVSPPVCLASFEGQNEQRWQKNWVPFEHLKTLKMAYSIEPHLILEPNITTGDCQTVAKTKIEKLEWDWGVLRGGTPAMRIGSEYLAFFHSSKEMKTAHSDGKKIQHYFAGAYTFDKDPPFRVIRVSKQPIVGRNFYEGLEHKTWKPVRVVFPGGFVADEKHIWMFYGRQDHEIWVAKLDKHELYQSMQSVSKPLDDF